MKILDANILTYIISLYGYFFIIQVDGLYVNRV